MVWPQCPFKDEQRFHARTRYGEERCSPTRIDSLDVPYLFDKGLKNTGLSSFFSTGSLASQQI